MAVAERPNTTNSPPVPCQLPTTILSTLAKPDVLTRSSATQNADNWRDTRCRRANCLFSHVCLVGLQKINLKLLHLPASHCRTRRHQGSIHRLRHPATASLWQRRLPTLDQGFSLRQE
ncbi:hypothetical protein P692DRAFT_20448586 [Suillus brevipes Sb2]|nr:hypothetical protein P692DRAFT_20448586 [Suillus brevipes Sb2]